MATLLNVKVIDPSSVYAQNVSDGTPVRVIHTEGPTVAVERLAEPGSWYWVRADHVVA